MKLKFCHFSLLGAIVSLTLASSALADQPSILRRFGGTTIVNTNVVRQVDQVNINRITNFSNTTFPNSVTPNNVTNTFINNFDNNGNRSYTGVYPTSQVNTIINRTIVYPSNTSTSVGGFVTNGLGSVNSVGQTNIYKINDNFNGNGQTTRDPNYLQNTNKVIIINVIPTNNKPNFCGNEICSTNSVGNSYSPNLIFLNGNSITQYGSSYRIR